MKKNWRKWSKTKYQRLIGIHGTTGNHVNILFSLAKLESERRYE